MRHPPARRAHRTAQPDHVDPVDLYVSIAALGFFYLSNVHTLSTIFDRNLLGAKAKVERLSHMTELVLGYLVHD